jgi:hypothetical protein
LLLKPLPTSASLLIQLLTSEAAPPPGLDDEDEDDTTTVAAETFELDGRLSPSGPAASSINTTAAGDEVTTSSSLSWNPSSSQPEDEPETQQRRSWFSGDELELKFGPLDVDESFLLGGRDGDCITGQRSGVEEGSCITTVRKILEIPCINR